MSRKDEVMALMEKVDEKELEIKALEEQINMLRFERNKFSSKIKDLAREEFEENGIVSGSTQYLSQAKTIIEVRPYDINWNSDSPSRTYKLEGSQRHESATKVPEEELLKKIANGELEKYDGSKKTLASLVRFKDFKHHKDNLYIGITARGKLVLIDTVYSIDMKNGVSYFIVKDKRYDLYALRRTSGSDYSNHTYNVSSSIRVIGYFDNYEDIVAYLI